MDLTDEVASDAALYALGQLDQEARVRFEYRLESGCRFCRAELAAFQEIASNLALLQPDSAAPVPSPSLKQRLMARIAAEPAPPPPAPPAGTILRRDGRRWLRGPAPGVEVQMLLQNKTMMVRMAPGSRIPAHHHHTDEQCLDLEDSLQAGAETATAVDIIHITKGADNADLD